MRITVEEVEWVLAHEDPEVVLRLREQAVRVDELESVTCFQCVPLVDVAVDEDGAFVAMGVDAPRCSGDCVVDGALRARMVQFLPGRRDEVGEPATLLGAGRQAALGRGSPDARSSIH